MRIGICCYPSYGGSGVVATELGKHLAKRGHDIHFISYDKPFRLEEFQEHVHFHCVDTANYPVFQHPPYIMALANKIAEVAKRESLDILHAHYAVPHATAVMLASQMLDRPIGTVTTLHGTDVTIMSEEDSLRQVMSYSVNQSDAITAVSRSLVEAATEAISPKLPIRMIHNFINLDEYSRDDERDIRGCLNIKPGEKVIVHTSNFRPVKRIEDVIRVFKGIQDKMPARLLLVGDGPESTKAYALAELLGVLDNIEFLGKQNRVTKILSTADVFLLPSEKESFGLAALEAMACGVPVLASNAGGLPEVIEHGVSGLLSEVGDVDQMTANALEILGSEAVHARYSNSARDRARTAFDVETIIREYEALYEEVIKKAK